MKLILRDLSLAKLFSEYHFQAFVDFLLFLKFFIDELIVFFKNCNALAKIKFSQCNNEHDEILNVFSKISSRSVHFIDDVC